MPSKFAGSADPHALVRVLATLIERLVPGLRVAAPESNVAALPVSGRRIPMQQRDRMIGHFSKMRYGQTFAHELRNPLCCPDVPPSETTNLVLHRTFETDL